METSVLTFAAVSFCVIGLSHILQPRAWVRYFIWLRGQGEAGAFFEGFLLLPFAALIISFHNVWHGLPVVLTVIGWTLLLKSLVRFLFPSTAIKIMSRVSLEKSWEFIVAGGVAMALSGLFTYALMTK